MRIVNLTPHPVTILDDNKNRITDLPACHDPPRARVDKRVVSEVCISDNNGRSHSLAIVHKDFKKPYGLPRKERDVMYVVSVIVAQASDRDDLLVPNTVRDQEGNILGCKSFSVVR